MGGASPELFNQFNREILNSFVLDYTVILTALPETVLNRTKARPELAIVDTKEQLSISRHEIMHELYLAHMQDRKCSFISTELPIGDVQNQILDSVLKGLNVS
jgi:thymidylate kinase